MKQETIALYAPGNAKNLTQQELAAMSSLTKEDIKELAATYPNTAQSSAYLILYDKSKKPKEQLYSLSTWKNLYELLKLGNTNFYAISFRSIFNKQEANNLAVAAMQDLTKKQALAGEGLKGNKATSSAKLQKAAEQDLTDTGGSDEGKQTAEADVKPIALDKMNKDELAAEYTRVTSEVPGSRMGKKAMIEAIQKVQKKK